MSLKIVRQLGVLSRIASIKQASSGLPYGLTVVRTLYSPITLGLDAFNDHRTHLQQQMRSVAEKFREKMHAYVGESSNNMIFTEDLKNMIHLASDDADVELVVKMLRKFNKQNKELRFGSFVFGPVVMRLFYTFNKAHLALECFKSEDFSGIFDQLVTYQIFLDLLYENEMHSEILDVFNMIENRNLESAKHPRNVVVLVMAACYKLNNEESWKYALDLWRKLMASGHFPMRRAVTFIAGLAIKQGEYTAALEILPMARNQNYTTVRNMRVVVLCNIGRVEEAVCQLKQLLQADTSLRPTFTTQLQTINADVIEVVRKAVSDLQSSDVTLEFERIVKLLQDQGHVCELTLDEQLCSKIMPPPVLQSQHDMHTNRFQSNAQVRQGNYRQKGGPRYSMRPGLKDIA